MRAKRFGRLVSNGCILAGLVFLGTLLGFGQTAPDPWLIVASGEKGSINARTTRNDLVRMYGANVVDRDVDTGEGEMQSATFLFPKDPERQIEILWKDPDTKAAPESADIRGKKSRWHGVHSITLGTSVTELENANGRPFHFALVNDGTDMAEELFEWQGGALEKEFQGSGRVILSLEWNPPKGTKPKGPSDFEANSKNPAWRALNPHITEMTWVFPSSSQP